MANQTAKKIEEKEASNVTPLVGKNDDGESAGISASGIGARLRAARLKSGKTLAEISDELKIRQTHLTSIEKEEFDALPGGAYTVGFIRTYAAAVGENGAEIIAVLKERQAVTTDVELPVYEKIETDVLPSKKTILGGLGLLVIVAGVWVSYEQGYFNVSAENETMTPIVMDGAVAQNPMPTVKEETPTIEAVTKKAAEKKQTEQEEVKETDEDVSAILSSMQSAKIPVDTAENKTIENLPITLVAHEDVWLSIYTEENPNAPILNTVLKSGQTYEVPQGNKLLANIGRPHVLSMNIGGQEYPMSGPEWGGVIKKLPMDSGYLISTFYGQKVNEESYHRWLKDHAE